MHCRSGTYVDFISFLFANGEEYKYGNYNGGGSLQVIRYIYLTYHLLLIDCLLDQMNDKVY